ncbi:MAG TPA: ABC transporter permease [Bryobacteraceae bacterium]|nr:ABC transporter permease [Bryobacteraceae bacterium]
MWSQDLRFAFRVIRQKPGFTVAAVSALALGIGANTAIFSVVNGLLLEPLPFKTASRLVSVGRTFQDGGVGLTASIPKFVVWKNNNRVFSAITAYDFSGPGLNLSGGDIPEQVKGIHSSAGFFEVFGVNPILGRTFTEEEDRPGGPPLAVVSYGLWKRHWGGDAQIIGRPIILNGEPYRVIGILPQDFRPDPPADVWIPLEADPTSTNQGNYLRVAAILKPGVTLETAKAQLKIVGEQFRRLYPKATGPEESVSAMPMKEFVVRDTRPALWILTGAVGFVLLIACADVANLLLARSAARMKEIAVRTALGAGRLRIIGQLLTESVLMAVIAGAVGLFIGVWGLRALLAASPVDLPRVAELTSGSWLAGLDWRMLLFTAGVSLVTGVLFGLFPAVHVARSDISSTLKESGSRTMTGRRQRARSALVVCEISLALVLLTGATLLIRTFISLRRVDGGFNAHNLLTLRTSLNGGKYASTAKVELLARRVIERLESLPGVQSATAAIAIPLELGPDIPFSIEGRPPSDGSPYNGDVQWRSATPHYFDALKIPLLRGRYFTIQDTAKAPPVVIINDAMAKRYWPNEDPIGQRITIGKGIGPEFDEPPRQIIGVVGNVRETGLNNPPPEVYYVPLGQVQDAVTRLVNSALPMSWLIRTSGDPRTLVAAVQHEFLAVDNELPVARVRTMQQVIQNSTARQSFNMLLLTIFAVIALLLAAIGVYGVMSYSVEQRTHEIGIRAALGARLPDLLRLVLSQGMRLAGIGLLIGVAASFALTRLMSGLLYGVKATDPATYVIVAAVLAGVAFIATYIPARRAAKIDPVIALRYE